MLNEAQISEIALEAQKESDYSFEDCVLMVNFINEDCNGVDPNQSFWFVKYWLWRALYRCKSSGLSMKEVVSTFQKGREQS